MEPDSILPPLNYHGCLPEGIHDCVFEQMRERFATNPTRVRLCERLQEFLRWAFSTGGFSYIYIDGGFVTNKTLPEDIDVILQPHAPSGIEALGAMEPFFKKGFNAIFEEYSVHLHFWCEGFSHGENDFRLFFQYMRPQDAASMGLREGARKGIIRIKL